MTTIIHLSSFQPYINGEQFCVAVPIQKDNRASYAVRLESQEAWLEDLNLRTQAGKPVTCRLAEELTWAPIPFVDRLKQRLSGAIFCAIKGGDFTDQGWVGECAFATQTERIVVNPCISKLIEVGGVQLHMLDLLMGPMLHPGLIDQLPNEHIEEASAAAISAGDMIPVFTGDGMVGGMLTVSRIPSPSGNEWHCNFDKYIFNRGLSAGEILFAKYHVDRANTSWLSETPIGVVADRRGGTLRR